MLWPNLPSLFLASGAIGLISAYLAHRRGKNPLVWFCVGFFFGALGIFAIFFSPNPKKKTPVETPTQPKPYLHGPSDRFWYYLDPSSSQQVGPMSYEAVSKAWKQGNISPVTLVWHEELVDWKPLQELIRVKS
ncbi:MAG TPA: DUF4339 domain-containing protein [Chlamydiales bacterium]